MEGNECYKFSTIRHYVDRTEAPPIRTVLDVGANVGHVTTLVAAFFPGAMIYAFEPVKEYFELGRRNTRHLSNVQWFNGAVSMQHRFTDDLGEHPRQTVANLRLLKALPEAGPGWGGGSIVLAEDHVAMTAPSAPFGFQHSRDPIVVCELDRFIAERGIGEIDLVKMDCEGCEHHVLGCVSLGVLSRMRYIVGEYHGIERFYRVMKGKLFRTHKVNLIGTSDLGCFFAERLDGERDGILRFDKSGMYQLRPWLCSTPIDWHLFNDAFVLPEERRCHALPEVM